MASPSGAPWSLLFWLRPTDSRFGFLRRAGPKILYFKLDLIREIFIVPPFSNQEIGMIKKTNKQSETQGTAARPTVKAAKAKTAKQRPNYPGEVASPATQAALKREVTFAVYQPDAERVFLSGVFNDWSTEATPLTRQPNRDWKTTVALTPGRYEYKFVVDGKWILDPRASVSAVNDFQTLNSVIEVKA